MHSAVTKQAPARKRFSASFGESYRESNRGPRRFRHEECRLLCPIPESTLQAVLPNSPGTVTPRTITILWIIPNDQRCTGSRNLSPSRHTLRRHPAEQRYISPRNCSSHCLISCRHANVLVQSRSSFAKAKLCALRR